MALRMESTAGRTFPARVSLAAAILLFAAKVIAWSITGSAALASDALESIVNVVAAGFAVWALSLAATPADENHPYGHGKIEFLSAGLKRYKEFHRRTVVKREAVTTLLVLDDIPRLVF